MLIFWWQGKGYNTIIIWLGVIIAFGIILAMGKQVIPDELWYWGLAHFAAAAINWRDGSRLNSRKLKKGPPRTGWRRLFYKAPHRFMSMPMESFSVVFITIGAALTVYSFVPTN